MGLSHKTVIGINHQTSQRRPLCTRLNHHKLSSRHFKSFYSILTTWNSVITLKWNADKRPKARKIDVGWEIVNFSHRKHMAEWETQNDLMRTQRSISILTINFRFSWNLGLEMDDSTEDLSTRRIIDNFYCYFIPMISSMRTQTHDTDWSICLSCARLKRLESFFWHEIDNKCN